MRDPRWLPRIPHECDAVLRLRAPDDTRVELDVRLRDLGPFGAGMSWRGPLDERLARRGTPADLTLNIDGHDVELPGIVAWSSRALDFWTIDLSLLPELAAAADSRRVNDWLLLRIADRDPLR